MRRELAGFLDSARRRGLARSLRLLASDLLFDLRFGTETRRVLEGSQLGTPVGETGGYDAIYHAVSPVIFDQAIRRLRELMPQLERAACFVDYGCGKGRALILAAHAGFGRVIGVECSPVLLECCEANLRHAWRRAGFTGRHETHLLDVVDYPTPDDSAVWFWFNPFDATRAGQVAAQLADSIKRQPRPACLVYVRPLQLAAVTAQGFQVADTVSSPSGYVEAVLLTPVPPAH